MGCLSISVTRIGGAEAEMTRIPEGGKASATRIGGILVEAERIGGGSASATRVSGATFRMGLVCGVDIGLAILWGSDDRLITLENGYLIVN